VAAGYLSSCLPVGQVLEQLRGWGGSWLPEQLPACWPGAGEAAEEGVAAGYLSSCLPVGQVLEKLRMRGWQLVT
jgi:hypothetical protein